MDLPVHVAAGALAGNILLYIHVKSRPRLDLDAEMVKIGVAGLLYGVISHLLLDALPYSALRALGLDPFLASQWLAIGLSLACFVSCLVIGRRYLGLSPAPSPGRAPGQ